MKKILITLAVLLPMLTVFTLAPAVVTAAPKDDACAGIEAAGGSCPAEGEGDGLSGIIRSVINILSIIVGAVSVIMIIIGGFRYVISGGDSSGVSGAKNTILYALIGLVLVLFAQVIVRFVWTQASQNT